MRVFLAVFLSGFLIFNLAQAQADAPWPPDPAEIFDETVEIVSVAHGQTGRSETRNPVADNEHRVVRFYNEDRNRWEVISYPDEIEQVLGSPQLWDNQILLAVPTGEDSEQPLNWILWRLDVETAEFDIFVPCPNTVVHDTFPNNPQWLFVTDVETNQVYLCDYQRGELHGPLPDETSRWSDLLVTPDRRYLLLQGSDTELVDRGGPYHFYGYEIATGRLNFLGAMGSLTFSSRFDDWLNNEQILYYQSTSPRHAEYFVMDITRPNSIESVIEGSFFDYREHPPRIEVLTTHAALTRQADLYEHIPCSLSAFDMITLKTYHYSLGYNCGGVYSPDGYRYYYVAFPSDPRVASSLKMLDLRSPGTTEIFENEIEALESVSPDGRYVALITDDNGVIDRNTMEDVQFFSWSQTNNPMVSFVDTTKGQIVYEVPFGQWFRNLDPLYEQVTHTTYEIGIPQVGVVWLNDSTCLVQQRSDTTQEWQHILLEFTDMGTVNTSLGGYARLILPDPRYVILSKDSESGTAYSLYDIGRHEKRSLFFNPYPGTYRYGVGVNEQNQLYLTVSRRITDFDSEWVEYILNIP
jgi:hypothetical protein